MSQIQSQQTPSAFGELTQKLSDSFHQAFDAHAQKPIASLLKSAHMALNQFSPPNPSPINSANAPQLSIKQGLAAFSHSALQGIESVLTASFILGTQAIELQCSMLKQHLCFSLKRER